jgi:hypothetical protein
MISQGPQPYIQMLLPIYTLYSVDVSVYVHAAEQEPRCQGACSGAVQPWIQMMASYFKSLDSKHMVSEPYCLCALSHVCVSCLHMVMITSRATLM